MKRLVLALVLFVSCTCRGDQAPTARPPTEKPHAQGEALFGDLTPTHGISQKLDERAPLTKGERQSFFAEHLSAQCQAAYGMQELPELRRFASEQQNSGQVSCWPSGDCGGHADNLSSVPLKTRSLAFGEHTDELEDALVKRLEGSIRGFLPGVNLARQNGTIWLSWADQDAQNPLELELRDKFKTMSVRAGISLRWQPCQGESGAACGVLPQVELALLALTPKAGSTRGASCTLFLGVPDELKAKGLSGPSRALRQLKSSALAALQDELAALGTCGDDSVQNRFEECDDHNAQSGDGCSASCRKEEH
jgi:cysteine-rich repeat protein